MTSEQKVMLALIQSVGASPAGWFPDLSTFRARNAGDRKVIDQLVADGSLQALGNQLAWTARGLRRLIPDQFARQESVRAAAVIEVLRKRYPSDPHRFYDAPTIQKWLQDQGEFTGERAPVVERAIVMLQSLNVLASMHSDVSNAKPVKIKLAETILDYNTTELFEPLMPPPPEVAAPHVSTAPADAIDGRWVRQLKPKPKRGANGEVVAVTDHVGEFRGQLALKMLLGVSEKSIARFKREMILLRSIRHPNVLQLLFASIDGEPPYFVSAYHNQNLAEYFASASLASADRLRLFAGICDGVDAAHSLGVVHRDLKPSNVLVDKSRRPVVADFGICHVSGNERHTGTEEQMGPRKYMAPELRDGRADDDAITAAADVYALGKILYFIFAPRARMFDRENYDSNENEITKVTGDESLGFLNDLFERTIVEEPAGRFQSAGQLAKKARALVPLALGNYRRVGPGGQRCQFCGEGRYEMRSPASLAIPKGQQDVRCLTCPVCGHALLFRVDTAQKVAKWGPRIQ